MILLKVAITILAVTTLSIIAERVSPRTAGILSGYPLGSAISLFFIGLEQGAQFAGASAPYNVAGMAALLTFLFVYYLTSTHIQRITQSRLWNMLAATLAATASFFALDVPLHILHLPVWGAFLAAAAAILGFSALFKNIPDSQIYKKIQMGPGVLLFRAAVAALMILAITGSAKLVPPSWAGLFSAFPATLLPLILIIHSTYGHRQAHTIIKNVPTGLWALVLYSVTISFAYPRAGIYWGSLLGFFNATLYLLALAYWNGRRPRIKIDPVGPEVIPGKRI